MKVGRMVYGVELFGTHAFQPEGVVASSPGLRGTSYPGGQSWNGFDPERVVLLPWCMYKRKQTRPQPFRVAALLATISQGSCVPRNLGFEAESLWDSSSRLRPRKASNVQVGASHLVMTFCHTYPTQLALSCSAHSGSCSGLRLAAR